MKKRFNGRYYLAAIAGLALSQFALAEVNVGITTLTLPDPYILDSDEGHAGLEFHIQSALTSTRGRSTARLRLSLTLAEQGSRTVIGSAEKVANYSVAEGLETPVLEMLVVEPMEWLDDQRLYNATLEVELSQSLLGEDYEAIATIPLNSLRVLDTTGALFFGDVPATVDSFANAPAYNIVDQTWSVKLGGGAVAGHALPGASLTVDNVAGQLVVMGGEVTLPGETQAPMEGWSMTLGDILLDEGGAFATSVSLELPPCVGNLDANTGLLQQHIQSNALYPLAADLSAKQGVANVLPSTVSVVAEELPLVFVVSAWSIRDGVLVFAKPRVEFARRALFDQWIAVKGEPPSSNDAFWYYVEKEAIGDLVIRHDERRGIDVRVTIAGTPFASHFPLAYIEHGGGSIEIESSQIAGGGASGLGAFTAYVLYGTGCRHPGAPHALPEPLVVFPIEGDALQMTPEGGLVADGVVIGKPAPDPAIATATQVHMGINGAGETVHRTDSFSGRTAGFYMPGGLTPAQSEPHLFQNQSIIVSEGSGSYEHPDIYTHVTGARYAGATIAWFEGLQGRSTVAGTTLGSYPMTPHAELYLRASGVSGIFGADETFLPQSVQVGEFIVDIDDWEFSALSNRQHESDIQGELHVPYPSDFSVAFDELYMNCCGNFDELILAPGAEQIELVYWNHSEIAIKQIAFRSSNPCLTEDPALKLAVAGRVNGLEEDRPGVLTILDNGRLTNAQHPHYEPSFLELEANTDLAGGYQAMPLRHAYFSDYDAWPTEENLGFINLIVENKAAFFDPIKVHATSNGYDFGDSPGIARQQVRMSGGWSGGGHTFFTNLDFDPSHIGWPQGRPGIATPLDYFDSDSEDYIPRAERQVWFATFGFPVKYEPFSGSFAATKDKGVDLGVVSANANLPRLSQDETELTFGTGFSLNLSNVLEALIAAGVDAATTALFDQIEVGFDAIDELLDSRLCVLIDEELSLGIETEISGKLFEALEGGITEVEIDALIEDCVIGRIQHIGIGGRIIGRVDGRFAQIENALGKVEEFLSLSAHLEGFAGATLHGIPCGDEVKAQLQAEVSAAMSGIADDLGLSGLGERLAALRDRVVEIRDYVQKMREEFNNAVGFAMEIENAINEGISTINTYADRIKGAIRPYLLEVADELSQYSDYAFDVFNEQLTLRLNVELCASAFLGKVQEAIRARVRLALAYALEQTVSSAFQQVSLFVADVTAGAVVDCSGVASKLDAVANFGEDYIQAGKLWGYAVINHEDLEMLRLDGEMVIHTEPIPIRLHPFFEWRVLNSDGSKGCVPALIPAEQKEVLLGATVSPAMMAESANNITLTSKFSFAEPVGGNTAEVIGLMGMLEVNASGGYAVPLMIERFSAMFSISGDGSDEFSNFEMYISAEAEATINLEPYSNLKLQAGIFAGQTCTADPLHWAPESKNHAPLRGVVVYAAGAFPVYDFGCVLNVTAKAGMELFFFDNAAGTVIGSTISGGVSGEVLCLLSASGDISLSAATAFGGDVLFSGSACLQAKAGICPLCKTFDDCVGFSFASGEGFSSDF